MIYKKEASFSYPILHNNSFEYDSHSFNLQLNNLVLDHDVYQLFFDFELTSEFLTQLIKNHQAELILVLQNKDNYFQSINLHQNMIEIPKTSIDFSGHMSAQLFLRAISLISFENNKDLIFSYEDYLPYISVRPGQLLAYSTIDETEAKIQKNIYLFRYNYVADLNSEIEIYPDDDYININIRKDIVNIFPQGKKESLWIPFMYQGLQASLIKLIEEVGDTEDILVIDGQHHFDGDQTLNRKLYDLLISHQIEEISKECLDEVVYKIAPNLIQTYYKELRRLNDEES